MSKKAAFLQQLNKQIVVSLFPGVGLLDRWFEESGFFLLRGPDKLWGGDIRHFHPPEGKIWGIIGGSPCQEFSRKFRGEPTGYSLQMLIEFARVVLEAQPEWWLLENVDRVPNVKIEGYIWQRFDIDQGWYSDVTRLRHIQFGSKSGRLLNVPRGKIVGQKQKAALANDKRSFDVMKQLQGLPPDYDLAPLKQKEKIRAIGNGVPKQMALALAQAIIEAYASPPPPMQLDLLGHKNPVGLCTCGECGRPAALGSNYAANIDGDTSRCRKVAEKRRKKTRSKNGNLL